MSTPVGIMGEVLEDGLNGYRAGFDVDSLATAIERTLADEEQRRAPAANRLSPEEHAPDLAAASGDDERDGEMNQRRMDQVQHRAVNRSAGRDPD